jgi:transcriptional regulator with XRE-family HTH domain
MKSIHSNKYKYIIGWLANKRKEAGITQKALSSQLDKPQSYISKVESRERRLDMIEFIEIVIAVGADPHEAIKNILSEKWKDFS